MISGKMKKRITSGSDDSSPQEQEESDLVAAKIDMEMTRFDYVAVLNEIRGKRRLDVVECVCACFYSLRTFFHQGMDTAEAIMGTFNEMNAKVQIQKQRAQLVQHISRPGS